MAESICSGCVKLVICFVFYLIWWVVGFNPKRPIRGLKSGWLLIPAGIFGVWALVEIFMGLDFNGPISGIGLAIFGVVAFVVLLAITTGPLKRPLTLELPLIVLWATVALLALNSLMALHAIAPEIGWTLMALCIACTAASLVCYQLFYGLDETKAFIVGAIPLLLAAVMTAIIAACAA